jgi:serine/threonine-protein kinase
MSERSTLPWARELKGDLDAIVATCLRKAPGERYRNVDALDAELQRWLEGRPVTARAPSWAYRSRLFIRRHRVAVGLSAALVAAIAVFGSGLALQAIELREQRNLAVIERDRALQVVEILESAFRNADPGRTAGDKVTARQILDAAAPRIESIKGSQPQVFGRLAATLAKVELDFGNHERAAALVESALEAHQPNSLYPDELLLIGSLANSRYGNLKRADQLLAQAESAPITNTALHSLARARYSSAMNDHATVLTITARALELDGSKGLADPSILISNEIRWLRAISIRESVSVEASLTYLDEIIAWQRTALSDNHPYLLRSRHHVLRFRNVNRPASELLEPTRQLLGEMLDTLGPNSSESASVRMLFAHLLNKVGRREESLDHFRQALTAQAASKGAEHVDTVRLKMIVAGVLHEDRTEPATDEAVKLMTEAFATCSRSYRPWSPITMTAEINLIRAHLSREEWGKAFYVGISSTKRNLNELTEPSSLSIYRRSLQELTSSRPCSTTDSNWRSECELVAQALSRLEAHIPPKET